MATEGAPLLAQSAAAPAATGNGVGSAFELAFWQSVAASEDRAQLEAYLAQYPQGTFSALARAKVAALDRANPAAASAPSQAQPPVPAPVAPVAPVVVSAPVAAPVAPAPVSAGLMTFPAMAAVPTPAAPPAPAQAPAPQVAQPVAVAAPAAATTDPFAKLAALNATKGAPAAPPIPAPAATVVAPAQALPAPVLAPASPAPAAVAVPAAAPAAQLARPQLAQVPAVSLPDHFCSAEERNKFHDVVYRPAVVVADQNNQAAITYMDRLQADYDVLSAKREVELANLIAREAANFRPVAQQAYADRTGFVSLFDRLMSVPITACK